MLKKLKVAIIIVLVLTGLFIAASLAVMIYGKAYVESAIKQNLKMEAHIGSISLRMPLSMHIKEIRIGKLFSASEVSFTPNIFGALAGKIVLNNLSIINPVVNIEQESGGSLNLPNFQKKGKQPPVFLTGLNIENGRIVFTDKKVAPDGYKTALDKINLRINKVMLPLTSLNAKFSLSAVLSDGALRPQGAIASKGQIDFIKKNMDANLKLKGLEVNHFAPYYGDFLSKKKIVSACVDLVSDFKAINNDLSIKNNFKLSKIVYAQEDQQENQLPEINFARNALDLFADREGVVALNFTIKTKLDKPSITVKELKKIMISAAVDNLTSQSPQDLVEKATSMIEKYKDLGKQLKSILKGD